MIRNLLSRCLLVPAVAVIAFSASAQDKLKNPTYQVGKSYELEMTQKMVMDMTAMGAAVGQPLGKTNINMVMGMVFDCKAHTVPDQRAITTSFSKVIMDMDMGEMKMSYDSTDPESKNSPLAPGMQPLLELQIVTILDKEDNVVEIQGLDKLEGMQGMDVEQLKQMSNPAAQLGIPKEGVSVGDEWENTMEMPMGKQVGKVAVDLKLKYEKDEVVEETNVAVVKYTGGINMEIAGEGAPAMKIEDATMEGTMSFDKANRVLKTGNTTGKMKMSMPNPAGGEALAIPLEFDQTFKMKEVKG